MRPACCGRRVRLAVGEEAAPLRKRERNDQQRAQREAAVGQCRDPVQWFDSPHEAAAKSNALDQT